MRIQYNKRGSFRIMTDDGNVQGEWCHYAGVATLVYMGKTFIAGSQYGLLPVCETVYELTEVPTTTESYEEP